MKIVETAIGKNNAGVKLFLHNDDTYRTTAVICPGGGYLFTAEGEGDPVALKFFEQGYNAAVLHYSTTGLQLKNEDPEKDSAAIRKEVLTAIEQQKEPISQFPQPLIDLAQTLNWLQENRKAYRLKNIITVGFSAGANLIALYGVYWNQPWLRQLTGNKALTRPAAQIACYGYYDLVHLDKVVYKTDEDEFTFAQAVLKAQYGTLEPSADQLRETSPALHLNAEVPPTFIWHTAEDKMIAAEEAVLFSQALSKKGIDWEMHIYSKGRHGLSLADDSQKEQETHVASWFALALSWLNYYL